MKAPSPLVLALAAALSCSACGRTASQPQPVPSTAEPGHIAGHFEVAEVVYDGNLGKGWDDWGWGPHELSAGQAARIGFASFGGIILHHDELPSRFGGLSFRFLAPPGFGDFLEVSLQYRQVDESALPLVKVEPRHIATLPDGWREVLVPWSALNPQNLPFDRIQIHARKPVPNDPVAIDKIVLTKPLPGAPINADTGPARRVDLMVDCSLPITRINPLIYGIAGDPWTVNSPARRMGGNPMTRFNWELGVWNVGADWFFQNVRIGKGPGVLEEWLQSDVDHGVQTALTVPMIGWVAKDDHSFGFPISKLGPQRAHDQHRQDSGDGVSPDGKPIKPGPPTQTSTPAPPELIGKWIANLRQQDEARGKRAVNMYILDNEPNLWNTTHRDVHPDPLTYDELLDRTVKYGTVIRKADPEGIIAGPAEWGWTAYFSSAKDVAPGATPHADRAAHGGVPLLPWYLRKLAAHEKQTGVRILDVLDVHYYPQAKGVWGNGAGTDRETAALRLRSTRSLWDPTYVDESWIDESVRLIPRLKDWIAQNYPGRGLQIGEWNFGAEEHMSGGLAVAEVLGRFGQQGVTSAYYWFSPPEKSPAAEAFRLYRNYDGKGGRFLDWSVPAEAAAKVSFFVSRDDPVKHVTAVILNLDPDASIDAYVDVGRCGTVTARRSFTYRDGDQGIQQRKVENKAAPERLSPYSMAVVEYALSK